MFLVFMIFFFPHIHLLFNVLVLFDGIDGYCVEHVYMYICKLNMCEELLLVIIIIFFSFFNFRTPLPLLKLSYG